MSTRIESSKITVTEPISCESEESPIGERIKLARENKQYSLEQLAKETGLRLELLQQIENSETTPPVAILIQISRALKMDSGYFLRKSDCQAKDRVQAYTKRTDNYAYNCLTPGAEDKHMKAFLVTLDPKKDHQGVGYQHEGEEFNYVLSGEIEVTVGDNKSRLKVGESLHFNSGVKHHLKNLADEKSELLVVIYTP